jgi:hypothetical protein
MDFVTGLDNHESNLWAKQQGIEMMNKMITADGTVKMPVV